MKKEIKVMIAAAALFATLSADTITYGGDAVSRYIFRGVDSGYPVGFVYGADEGWQNNVPAFQPGVTYAFTNGLLNGLSTGLWGSYGVGNKSSKELDELDLTVAYAFKFADVDYKVGYTHYTFPTLATYMEKNVDLSSADAQKATAQDEQFFGVAFNNVFLAPSFTIYNEYTQRFVKDDRTQYSYAELGLTLPTLPYGLANSLIVAFDGSFPNTGAALSNINYKVAKDLGSGFTGYTNLIYLTGLKGSAAFTGTKGSDEKRDPVNNDAFEVVFGVNYTGALTL